MNDNRKKEEKPIFLSIYNRDIQTKEDIAILKDIQKSIIKAIRMARKQQEKLSKYIFNSKKSNETKKINNRRNENGKI